MLIYTRIVQTIKTATTLFIEYYAWRDSLFTLKGKKTRRMKVSIPIDKYMPLKFRTLKLSADLNF